MVFALFRVGDGSVLPSRGEETKAHGMKCTEIDANVA